MSKVCIMNNERSINRRVVVVCVVVVVVLSAAVVLVSWLSRCREQNGTTRKKEKHAFPSTTKLYVPFQNWRLTVV